MSAVVPGVLPKVGKAACEEPLLQARGAPSLAVTLFGIPLLLLGSPGTSAAQIASVEVSAEVVIPEDPVLVARDMAPADGGWAEHTLPARPGIVRARVMQKPRAADGSAGVMLQVVLDYTGN